MNNPLLLLLRLEGLMQSWGERAHWDLRDTSPLPTKSAIIGLLACSLGLTRNHPDILQLGKELSIGVRADRSGSQFTDYQTVSGSIATASGGSRGRKDEESTIVSIRQYICDGSFLVVLGGPEVQLETLASALQAPKWPIYLGRKACVPMRPVFEALTDNYLSLEDALQNAPFCERSDHYAICEIDAPSGFTFRRDILLPSPSRHYLTRRINRFSVKNNIEEAVL
ncbi:MAG: type I-E CRISPR-associated protein Cas5/CasD [Syntrophomonadaceae bacterium]|nr:type I-E CRISPR-associated protein Cas5/CasD [Syntrophomonadaceae bacterium]